MITFKCKICGEDTHSKFKELCLKHWKVENGIVNLRCKICGVDTGSPKKELCMYHFMQSLPAKKRFCKNCGIEIESPVSFCDKCDKKMNMVNGFKKNKISKGGKQLVKKQ